MDIAYRLVETALTKWITSICGWLIALMLAGGAMVHVMNMLGKGGKPWKEFSMLLRTMDVVLLAFNLVVVAGLILRMPWAVFLLYGGMICLQIIPYTAFRSHFISRPEDRAMLNGLIATEAIMLATYAGILVWQGYGGGV